MIGRKHREVILHPFLREHLVQVGTQLRDELSKFSDFCLQGGEIIRIDRGRGG